MRACRKNYCDADEDMANSGSWCYKKCPPGWTGVAGVCWQVRTGMLATALDPS